ncbi:cache domain-containing sensor histidine kinase [Saccharibacillus endophyticus]|uniref:histidine kinase n=1 Tax=Saccharibacillus endophyticus TaxID=2060666 RepID=A0ABQ2A1P9_9BACL|nr:sensor histidine kinase [Saccharibacillus endophyticus]GGH82332.1 sensor histidine kinase [Saccharibacillus endophyticus]
MKIAPLVRKFFGRLRFKSKVMAVFMPLLILSLLTLGLLSSHLFSTSLIERTTRNVADESKLILSRTDYLFRSAETASNIMVTDINRLYETQSPGTTPLEKNRFANLMQSRLSIDLSIFREVDAAVFVTRDGTMHASYMTANDESGFADSGMLERVREAGSYGTDQWFPMERRSYLTPDPASPVLTLGKRVIDINSGETLGTLFLLMKEERFSAFLQSSDPAAPKAYYFVDSEMRITAAADKSNLLEEVPPSLRSAIQQNGQQRANSGSDVFSYWEKGNLVTVSRYAPMEWELVNVVSLKLLTADVQENGRLTILVGAMCLIFSWLGANFLSRMVVGPLERLTRAMRQVVRGELNPVTEIKSEDELGTISQAFNFMVRRVRELLEEVTLEQKRKREYELALVSAQIKPHFLYNTLDTIYVLNELDRNDDARDTTKALADFYRTVLSQGRELIILEKEAALTDDYLAIMQIRYPDVFRYELDIPSELSGTPIPKLSLQPLVENAIYHGLKPTGRMGFISIRAEANGDRVRIRVSDNGMGMDEARVRSILTAQSQEEAVSVGTYSVRQRLKLYFGDDYGLKIDSTPGEGTVVELSLPILHTQGDEPHV